ncbi:hypothetical protein PVT68_08350 [Microbulbifer bruguierae]|uniref:SPOR domain-containing protein n=1 Tax=Microbulbifer bruguierae TaxID=3029061 RepID=A0ABY8NIL1_9GAMM|nr:hypothetical protein [Microbulbifer bruguierae]WGL18290.1 hypothetical protein PVT68_08350 [Microbulbifer bruguierae]
MRWIFLFLVVANLALLGWFLTSGRNPAVVSAPAIDDDRVPGITLVGEAGPGQLAPAKAKNSRGRSGEAPVVEEKPGDGAEDKRPAGGLCTMVGPFAEGYQGEDVAQRLQALDVEAALREIEMQGQMRYWVYLAPLNSSQEAFRKLRELQAAGVDSYVIPKGSLENGISFGIFSEMDRAKAMTADLQQRGFAAEYREEPQTYLERWVVVEGGGERQIADAFWQQLQLDYPDIGRRQNLCSEIRATENP